MYEYKQVFVDSIWEALQENKGWEFVAKEYNSDKGWYVILKQPAPIEFIVSDSFSEKRRNAITQLVSNFEKY